MAEILTNVTYALLSAHRELDAELQKCISEHHASLRCSNPGAVCRLIERFVDAFNQVPGGQDELRRRATFIATRCGSGSQYDLARWRVQARCKKNPSAERHAELGIQDLLRVSATPFLAGVTESRALIDRVLHEGRPPLSETVRRDLEDLRIACRQIQREAELLEVDGCWCAFNVEAASHGEPSGDAEMAIALITGNMGGAHLKEIKAAADSMVAWAATILDELTGTQSGSGKAGDTESPTASFPGDENVRANILPLFPNGEPGNKNLRDLAIRLRVCKGNGQSENVITRQFLEENKLPAASAASLLSQLRRLKRDGLVNI